MGKIIALVGMCGSGKSVLTEMFVGRGFTKIYFGGLTMRELEKRGLPKTEPNERAVREELRKTYGQAAFAILLCDDIEKASKDSNVILDGLYSWEEYKVLCERFGANFSVLSVVTNSGLRYSRLASRKIRPLTFAEAKSRDWSEIENLQKGGPIAIADAYIENNGSYDELCKRFENFINKFTKE